MEGETRLKIIPAIDLMKGKVVRLTRGDPEKLKEYEHFGDPITVAKKWENEKADAIHVIDLDAALDIGSNINEITKIIQEVNIPIQVGGGIRTFEIAENLLSMDVDRIIVGTLAFNDPLAFSTLLKNFGCDRVVVALDHSGGEIMVRGWRDATRINVDDAIVKFIDLGVKFFLMTSISRDGMLTGPDIFLLAKTKNFIGVNIIAAGGVSSLKDLITLKQIGVWGVVIGKALYEGLFNLKEAIEIGKKE